MIGKVKNSCQSFNNHRTNKRNITMTPLQHSQLLISSRCDSTPHTIEELLTLCNLEVMQWIRILISILNLRNSPVFQEHTVVQMKNCRSGELKHIFYHSFGQSIRAIFEMSTAKVRAICSQSNQMLMNEIRHKWL